MPAQGDQSGETIGAANAPRRWPALTDCLWVIVAVLPLQMVYYYHFAERKGATGFTHSDMPQYTANGREIFERGNGLSYPNPYDDDPAAPRIYFHWLLSLFGVGVVKLGLDPGHLTMGVGIACSFWLGWLTLRLVDAVTQTRDYRIPLFLLAMWAGGVICAASVGENLREGRWWREDLLALDPGWNHNWGRNLIYSTEVVYHIISACCWLAIFRGRWTWATIAGLLLATTHPFSGLQLIGALCVWWAIQLVWRRDKASVIHAGACVAIALGFLGYNLVYLNSFAQHRAIHDKLTLPHFLTNTDILLAYGPVAFIAVARLWIDRRSLRPADLFLLAMFGVSFLLSTHDRFLPIKPIEPKHFTRGYVWMPLFLIGLPLVQRCVLQLRNIVTTAFARWNSSSAWRMIAIHTVVSLVLVPCGVFACFDNLCFNFLLFGLNRNEVTAQGCFLPPGARDALAWIDVQQLNGVLLCPGTGTRWDTPHRMTSYLSTSYTSLRPYIGHHIMTPDLETRVEQVEDWTNGVGEHPWFASIDYILAGNDVSLPLLLRSEWETIYENGQYTLLRRK